MIITLYVSLILFTVCILCIDHVAVGMSEVIDSCFEAREANSFQSVAIFRNVSVFITLAA